MFPSVVTATHTLRLLIYGQDEIACHLHPIIFTWDAVTTCTPVTIFFPLKVPSLALSPNSNPIIPTLNHLANKPQQIQSLLHAPRERGFLEPHSVGFLLVAVPVCGKLKHSYTCITHAHFGICTHMSALHVSIACLHRISASHVCIAYLHRISAYCMSIIRHALCRLTITVSLIVEITVKLNE